MEGTGPHSIRRAMQLQLLGAFELRIDGRPVALPPSAQHVLAFLALSEHRFSRGFVGGTLWPSRTEERAAASLRTAVWRLQRVHPQLIEADARRVGLTAGIWVDYREGSALARRALKEDISDSAVLDVLCRSGELLPDWYDEWLDLERERFRLLRARALEHLAQRLADQGNYGAAAEAGLAAVASDPLRDTAQRALIRVFLAEGNAFEALRQFQQYRSLSLRYLGAEPSDETARLVGHLETEIGFAPAHATISGERRRGGSGTSAV
jgi:DNA-binding SARP family transcriptional activator